MNFAEFIDECTANGAELPDYITRDRGMHWNVFHDRDTGASQPCATLCFETQGAKPGSAPHTVVVSFKRDPKGAEDFVAWCGDPFFEGHMQPAAARARIDDAIAFALTALPDANHARLKAALASGMGAGGTKSGGCNFWAKRKVGGCKHYKHVLARLDTSQVEALMAEYDDMVCATKPAAVAAAACTLADELAKSAFAHPVLLFGPPGSGKSHAARCFADDAAITYIEAGLHEGSEAVDVLGSMGPFKGGWVWRDGPLSEGFRKAARGEKVVLCLDELLRMRSNHRSALLSAFGEFRGTYTLRTGRILSEDDGVGQEETLRCSTSNLFVVATTNIGDQFALDGMDDALKSRFKLLHVPASTETLQAAVDADLDGKSWSAKDKEWARKKMVELVKQSDKAVKSGALQAVLDVRAVKRIVSSAQEVRELQDRAQSECMQCVGLSSEGEPIKEHQVHYTAMVNKVLGGK